MMASFNGNHVLLVGLGDGNLLTFTISTADPNAPPPPPGTDASSTGASDPMSVVDDNGDGGSSNGALRHSLSNRKKISLGEDWTGVTFREETGL